MKTLLKVTVAAAALAGLAACDRMGGSNGSAGNSGAANTVAMNTAGNATVDAGGKDPAAAGGGAGAAPAAFTGEVTPAFLVGRWTDTGDCTQTIEFRDDGSFATATGGTGYWTLNGDRLTFQGTSTVSAQIAAPNQDTIMLTHANGSVGRSTRCS